MEQINLYKLVGFYLRNWLLILAFTLFGLLSGYIYNQFIQTPIYKSDATLLLLKDKSGYQDTTTLNNYVQLFQSRRVLEPVIEEKNLDITFDDFKKGVIATNDKNTEVIRLSISTNDASLSQGFLSSAVESFKSEAKKLYPSYNLVVVDGASNAQPPYNVNKNLQLIIAALIGFGVSLLVLFFIFDAKKGQVQDWGMKLKEKRTAFIVRRKAAKAKRKERVSVPRRKLKANSTFVTIFNRFKESAKRSLWIKESTFDVKSRDETED